MIGYVKEISLPTYKESYRVVFTQPGLRYAQAKKLVEILLDDPSLQKYDFAILNALKEKLLSDVKGRMIENIVLYETSLKNEDTFKFYFSVYGEYDMVTLDIDNHQSDIYEIKHSSVIDEKQYRFLIDGELQNTFEKKYYPVNHKRVLYLGEDTKVDDIEYINIETYLASI